MKRLLLFLVAPFLLFTVATAAVVPAEPVHAVPCSQNAPSLFGFPTWYEYLDCDANGVPNFDDASGETDLGRIWLIAAAVLEILIRLAGLLSVFYIIYGGFKYLTSQGNPDQTAAARKSIIYALAGVVIAVIGTAAVGLIGRTLSGGSGGGLAAGPAADSAAIQRVLTIIYAIAGAGAAILVVIGGFKFVTANGDPQKVSSGRNTIIYALVGLFVVLLAAVITNYVLTSL